MVCYLDIETTGLSDEDRMIEIAIIGEENQVLLHHILNPERSLSQRIQALTGFSNEILQEQPKFANIEADVLALFSEHQPVVIYNKKFDVRFFPHHFFRDISTSCALEAFRNAYGNGTTLDVAARLAGHEWDGPPHRAVTDARACRTVWNWSLERQRTMDALFHNRSPAEIAQMAFEAQQRLKAAEEELDACKKKLIEIAAGSKFEIGVPGVCKVTVSATPKISDKPTYLVDRDAFDLLDSTLREELIRNAVIKERKRSDEPRSPAIRISPL